MGIIEVINAYKQYESSVDAKVVLSNFNMNVQKGSIYALMGASGCGKTTLISCIIGTNSLDKGHIEVFNDVVGKNKTRIGYMPQEIALINEFTIREMIRFYGIIYGMDLDTIDERIYFLSKLLELPDEDRLIRNCSGGQQRRVSFAIALVHEPAVLILDEPTVGVDPLLRSKIWDYLVEITSKKNVTVLLSTHYIEEARQSTHVGLMRNGVQIAQGTPQNLLAKFETDSLEVVFLRLSERQEVGEKFSFVNETAATESTSTTRQSLKRLKSDVEWAPASGVRKLRALVMKNFIQVIRSPAFLFFALLIPLSGIFCLHYTIGDKPIGLLLGIVNDEVSANDCFNRSTSTIVIGESACLMNKISCRFVSEIDDSIAFKKHYDNFDLAYDDAKAAKIIGFIHFAYNFSDSFAVLKDRHDIDASDNGMIQIHLDNTDLQIVTYLQRNLYRIYERFIVGVLDDCEMSLGIGKIPLIFETFNGLLESELKNSLVPGFLVATFFSAASYLTAMALIEDRLSGMWNRALAAGATPRQFLMSHLITGSMIMLFQAAEFVVYTLIISDDNESWRLIMIPILILLVGLAGTLYGLVLSVVTDSTLVATYFSVMLTFPFTFLSGILWPLEAIPQFLWFIGCLLPFTLPSRTLILLMYSEYQFTSEKVYTGLIVIVAWVILPLVICFWLTRTRNVKKTK